MKKFILGIAGYIGSGKSLAGDYFKQHGAVFIDADEVVDRLYQPGREGYLKIVNYFGPEFLTKQGLVNRKKLGKFVFGDVNKLKILNFLIHPLVTSEIRKLIDKVDGKFVVIEATYFENKHLGGLVDAVLWIDCEKDVLLRRALKRAGMTEEKFLRILKTQPKPEKIDYVVTNNKTKADFILQLTDILKGLPFDHLKK